MASSLRQSSTTAVNFFFLVDIFTCVLGILILVTLMLTTQANSNTETPVWGHGFGSRTAAGTDAVVG